MSILIVDSGSTKSDWRYVTEHDTVSCQTEGFNPYFITPQEMVDSINKNLKPLISIQPIGKIYFYGAGCASEDKRELVRDVLQKSFPGTEIEVETDMLGAARGLLGNKKGFAAILGTGSNSCWYDGKKITKTIDSLGYVLGDEGSGAYIGRQVIREWLRNGLSPEAEVKFFQFCQLTRNEIMSKVYNEPHPNRFLASFAPFASQNIERSEIATLVHETFEMFLMEIVDRYDLPEGTRLHFCGSVAFAFRHFIEEVAPPEYTFGKVLQSPMEELVKFHTSK